MKRIEVGDILVGVENEEEKVIVDEVLRRFNQIHILRNCVSSVKPTGYGATWVFIERYARMPKTWTNPVLDAVGFRLLTDPEEIAAALAELIAVHGDKVPGTEREGT